MTRTLYLHIGVHRTGTTSIQSFLRKNFVALQRQGIFNPFAAGRHFGLINKIFSGELGTAEAALDICARADGKKFPLSRIVISDEDICMRRDLSVLAQFRDHFDVRIILSMRRQDLWLESWHQQNVKWQWNPALAHLTFEDFLDRRDEFHWIHYDRLVGQLEELFGADALDLLVFERERMPEGPVAAFARIIGLESLEGFSDPPHVNTSLSPLMSEFMRTLPLDEFPGPLRRLFERACAQTDREIGKALGKDRPASSLLMDAARRAEIVAEYAQGNRAVAERHFKRPDLFGAPLPPAEAPVAPQRLPGDSYETIDRFVAPMLRALAEQIDSMDKDERDSASP